MDWFSYIASGLLVYVGIAVFVIGMAWRVWTWSRTPRSAVRLGLFPKPKSSVGRFGKLVTDTFVAPQSARIEPVMWAFAFAFHVAALAAFVGHLRLLHEFTPLVAILGEEGMNSFAAWAGSIAGSIMLVGVVFWIVRRTFGAYKSLSVPEDYLLLFLLLGIIVLGDHLRFFGGIHGPSYIEWFQSLLAFRPDFPPEIANSPSKWVLDGHMILVSVFLIYFPFSKLTHTIGAFATNLTRSSE